MSTRSRLRSLYRFIILRWWSWRHTRRLLLACVAFVTLIAIFYQVENWRGRRAFAAAEREAAAAGVSLTLRDYFSAPVPDDQNLAKIPPLDAPAERSARDSFWNTLAAELNYPAVDGAPSPWDNLPGEGNRLHEALRGDEHAGENLDDYLRRVSPLLAEIARAAETRPYLVYRYEWTDPVAVIVNNPHFLPLRSLGRASSLQARVALTRHQPEQAAAAIALSLRLATAIQREPVLISQMIAVAVTNNALSLIWEGQLRHHWRDSELDTFASLLGENRVIPSFRHAYAAETAFGATLLLDLPNSLPDSDSIDKESAMLRAWSRWLPDGWILQNAASVVRYHLEHSLPGFDSQQELIHYVPTEPNAAPSPKGFILYTMFARMLTPALERIALTAGQGKTQHDLARLAVALEKHFLTHGSYPDALAAVLADDPALATLHDPFDGQPYRYRRDADGGFTLWGVGQNLRDDGGAFPDANAASGANRYDTGDLVWRIPGRSR